LKKKVSHNDIIYELVCVNTPHEVVERKKGRIIILWNLL